MKNICYKLTTIFMSFFVIFSQIVTIANADEIILPKSNDNNVKNDYNEINALIVRLGYEDYPTDSGNEFYIDDDTLHTWFDTSNKNIDYKHKSLSDYLKQSSYGSLSLKIGDIIDIKMDRSSYDYSVEAQNDKYVIDSDEFNQKLYDIVDISNYDHNADGKIDALFIFNCNDNMYTNAMGLTHRNRYDQKYSFFTFFDKDVSISDIQRTIIHETGHLLFDFKDYYRLYKYLSSPYPFNDIDNIMGWGYGDYDAVSKLKAGWLTEDNIISVNPVYGEKGVINLSPYDSDLPHGKKIAIFKCGSDYIAVDYCGGLNNNAIDVDGYNYGFRFYILDEKDLEPIQIHFSENESGVYQLLKDGDEANPFRKGLFINNIHTGENPSFSYSYEDYIYDYDDFDDLDPEEELIPPQKMEYVVRLFDYDDDTYEIRNEITDQAEIEITDITDPLKVAFVDNYYAVSGHQTNNNIFSYTYYPDLWHHLYKKTVQTRIKTLSVPVGFKQIDGIVTYKKEGLYSSIDNSGFYSHAPYVTFEDGVETVNIDIFLEKNIIEDPNTDQTQDTDIEVGTDEKKQSNDDEQATVTEPTTPTAPSEPAEPTEPTEPTESTEPIDATESTDATEPTEPNEPTEPTASTEPTVPTDPKDKSDPVNDSNNTDKKNQDNSGKNSNIAADSSDKQVSTSSAGRSNAAKVTDIVGGSASTSNKPAPQTGDNSNVPLWLTIAGASAGVLTTALIARKRKRS